MSRYNGRILREVASGKIMGKISDYWFNTDDHEDNWVNEPTGTIVFPKHENYAPSPVTISYLK